MWERSAPILPSRFAVKMYISESYGCLDRNLSYNLARTVDETVDDDEFSREDLAIAKRFLYHKPLCVAAFINFRMNAHRAAFIDRQANLYREEDIEGGRSNPRTVYRKQQHKGKHCKC